MVELWLKSNLTGVWENIGLGNDLVISITKSFEDIEDFTSRQSSYSKTFQIPQTDNNNRFFRDAFMVNGSSFSTSVVVGAVIKYAGADVFNGECRLNKIGVEVNGGYYEVFLTQTLPDFALSIGDVKLTDLDFSGLTHTLDYDNIVSTWSYSGGSYDSYSGLTGKVLYPLAHYGYDINQYYSEFNTGLSGFTQSGKPLSNTQFAPWISAKYLIDQIFQRSQYTYDSSFFNSEYFNGIFALAKTQSSQGAYISSAATENQNVFSVDANYRFYDNADGNFDNTFIKGFILTRELNDPLNIFSPSINFQNRGHFFTAAVDGTYKFKVGFSMFVRDGYYPTYVNIALKDVDTGQIYNKVEGLVIFATTELTEYGNIYLNCDLTAGSRVGFYYSRVSTAGIPSQQLGIWNAYWELYSSPILAGSQNVLFQNNLPTEITCLDFFKGIVSLFNLVVIPQGENNLLIEKWDDYFSSGVERDWSQKLDLAAGYTLEPTNQLKKEYVVKYKDSDDRFGVINKNDRNWQFGTYRYISNTGFHNGTEIIEIPFEPLPISTFDTETQSNILIPHIYTWNTNINQDTTGTDITAFQPLGSGIRLGFYNGMLDSKITGTTTNWYMLSGATSVAHTTYPAISHLSSYEYLPSTFSDLNIGNQYDYWQIPNNDYVGYTEHSVWNDFWASRIDPLYDADTKIFTGTFKLSPVDVNDIDFNDKVYFQNAWWRLLEMTDADITDVSMVQCQFIKLPYTPAVVELIPPTYEQATPPSPTPTPSASTYTHNVYVSTSINALCSETATINLVYSNCSILSAGCSVFSDNTATTPISEGTLLKVGGSSTIYQVIEYGILTNFYTC